MIHDFLDNSECSVRIFRLRGLWEDVACEQGVVPQVFIEPVGVGQARCVFIQVGVNRCEWRFFLGNWCLPCRFRSSLISFPSKMDCVAEPIFELPTADTADGAVGH